MPVAMCECNFCEEGSERLRPGLLIETEETALIFDIGPDLRQQLIETDVKNVDGFFGTHVHTDHFGGLPELHQLHQFTDEQITLYGNSYLSKYIDQFFPWVNLNFQTFESEQVKIGDLKVSSFPIEHSKDFPTQGFAIEKNGKKIVYIPDLKSVPDRKEYKNADLAFVDGMYLFKKHIEEDQDHASGEELKKQIEKINADKTVLVNISEHFNEMTAEEEKQKTKYIIGEDFKTYSI